MRTSSLLLIATSAAFAVARINAAPPQAVAQVPGQRADGSVLLPNQWVLRPVGKQVPVGDFPVNIAVHPNGKWAAVLHCGYGQHEIAILDLKTGKVASRRNINEAFYGIAFFKEGKGLICSGGGDEELHGFEFEPETGTIGKDDVLKVNEPRVRGIPAGFAIGEKYGSGFIANVWGQTVTRFSQGENGKELVSELALKEDVRAPAEEEKPAVKEGDKAEPPTPNAAPRSGEAETTGKGGAVPFTGILPTDDPSITKRALVTMDKARGDEPFPYCCVLDEEKGRLYVSLWGQAAVAVIDTAAFQVVARWKVEEHPNEMLLSKDGSRLFVANANRNTVSVLDTATGLATETLLAELHPAAEPGNTPNSLALSPDEKRLYVANANINMVAVFDLAEAGKARSLGFIPVGWYPTSVRVTPDGKTLLVANGKGQISKSNRNGPQPGKPGGPGINEYIAGLMQGTVSIIPLESGEKGEKQLKTWTSRAYKCLPEGTGRIDLAALEGNPVPHGKITESPIKYVIYVVKENRTYDQVLGDMKEGNGDPTLCLFPENVTPNHHALAREFVLLDNFYVESEVSADGHEWSMGAYASDFVEKMWPLGYGHGDKVPYVAEGAFPIATPAGGYLWDRAKEAGVTYRSYGEWVRNAKNPEEPGTVTSEALKGHFDPMYRSFDTAYPDVKRAARFVAELATFQEKGEMPRLQIVRLPNDHTSGSSPGRATPAAAVADNDLALGQVVEAVSKSRFWPETAIFVVEDDAQNGPDHVDAHRTIAFAISPWIRRKSVDSTLYSTSSMLRTMELILGMKPMSQFDAASMPMFASFSSKPDKAPYVARPANIDLEAVNKKTAWKAEETATMNFAKEDAVDDLLLNEMIWRSVRGATSPMPAPHRAAFVFTADDDD